MLVWAGMLGLAFFSLSLWLVPHLMDGAWYWYPLGGFIGILLALILVGSIASGSHCRVTEQGSCSYGFGQRPNIRFPLNQVRSWGYVSAGVLRGVGVDIAIESIEVLHRKGLSISKMQSYQQQLGYTLVLEFLKPDDGQALQELGLRFQSP
jgi:hypothetical protein